MSCYESQDVTGIAERVTKAPELSHDTREKLEEDVCEEVGHYFAWQEKRDQFANKIVEWLDRQASITEREMEDVFLDRADIVITRREIEKRDLQQQVNDLTAERDQWRDAYGDSERMRLELVKDLEHARRWSDTWRDLVHRYEGLCDGLLDERDRLRGEAS